MRCDSQRQSFEKSDADGLLQSSETPIFQYRDDLVLTKREQWLNDQLSHFTLLLPRQS